MANDLLTTLNGSGPELLANHALEAAGMADQAGEAAKANPPDTNAAGSAAAAAAAHAAAATAISTATRGSATMTTARLLKGGTATAAAYIFWTFGAATFVKGMFSNGKLNLLIASTAVILTALVSAAEAVVKARQARKTDPAGPAGGAA